MNDFRAFPGPKDYEFNLNSKNLLLFGENGSGKSSIFVALREFFNRATRPRPFQEFRNVFTADPAGQPLNTGKVSVEFDDGTGLHTWDIGANVRPIAAPPVADASLRFGAVDYRAMLRTDFTHTSGIPNLYSLLVDGVLKRMPVLVAGGRQTTLGAIVERMNDAVPAPYKWHTTQKVDQINTALTDFNNALTNHLPQVVAEANNVLAAFGNHGVTFQLAPRAVRYVRTTKSYEDQRIDFVAQLYGHGPAEPQHFLNEARLSALALAIYLAAIKVSIIAPPPGVNPPAKVIILDDVLIGLDMSNRQPLLDVLTRQDQPGQPGFADWQVILMTHDQAWHALARKQITRREWQVGRLATGFNGRHDFPIHYDDTSLIDRAEHYLNQHGDERASGVYLRLAFEEMLKAFCLRTQLPVACHLPDHRVNTETFWKPICRVKIGSRLFVDPGLRQAVESCRRNVANPLCHHGNHTPLRAEVVTAISVLRRLQSVLDSYPASDQKPPVPPRPALELAIEACNLPVNFSPWTAAVHLRSAFDDALASLATRKRLTVRYDIHFIDFEGQRLWQALLQPPVDLRTNHPAGVAGIHTHSAVFLSALDQAALIVQPQNFFQAALQSLVAAPATPPAAPTTWLHAVP